MDELAWPLPPPQLSARPKVGNGQGRIVKGNSGNGRLVRFITVEISPPERVLTVLNHFPESCRACRGHPRRGLVVALLPADDENLENVPARPPYHPLGPSAIGLTRGSIFFA
jgi:hypothetical protein